MQEKPRVIFYLVVLQCSVVSKGRAVEPSILLQGLDQFGNNANAELETEADDLSRDKRHQQRRNWTADDWQIYENSRRVELYDYDVNVFQLEVHEAENLSICNYTVIPIPNPGGRVPRVLEHLKCNYVGNRCQERGSYCCAQLYTYIDVAYPDKNDTIKLYTGCVCALQIYGDLEPYNPSLPLDD